MSFIYDSSNTRDNEGRKFQPDSAGDVAVNIKANDTLQTLNGWLWKQVGRKVVRTSINAVTEDYSFQQDNIEQIRIRVIYSDSTKNDLSSAERTV